MRKCCYFILGKSGKRNKFITCFACRIDKIWAMFSNLEPGTQPKSMLAYYVFASLNIMQCSLTWSWFLFRTRLHFPVTVSKYSLSDHFTLRWSLLISRNMANFFMIKVFNLPVNIKSWYPGSDPLLCHCTCINLFP